MPHCPHQDVIALYAKHLPELPSPKIWNGQRANNLKSRWRWVLAFLLEVVPGLLSAFRGQAQGSNLLIAAHNVDLAESAQSVIKPDEGVLHFNGCRQVAKQRLQQLDPLAIDRRSSTHCLKL